MDETYESNGTPVITAHGPRHLDQALRKPLLTPVYPPHTPHTSKPQQTR